MRSFYENSRASRKSARLTRSAVASFRRRPTGTEKEAEQEEEEEDERSTVRPKSVFSAVLLLPFEMDEEFGRGGGPTSATVADDDDDDDDDDGEEYVEATTNDDASLVTTMATATSATPPLSSAPSPAIVSGNGNLRSKPPSKRQVTAKGQMSHMRHPDLYSKGFPHLPLCDRSSLHPDIPRPFSIP